MPYQTCAVGHKLSERFEVQGVCFSSPTKQIYLHTEYFVRLGFLGWGLGFLYLGSSLCFAGAFFPFTLHPSTSPAVLPADSPLD